MQHFIRRAGAVPLMRRSVRPPAMRNVRLRCPRAATLTGAAAAAAAAAMSVSWALCDESIVEPAADACGYRPVSSVVGGPMDYEECVVHDTVKSGWEARREEGRMGRAVVCFVDGSPSSMAALEEACRGKERHDLLTVVTMVETLEPEQFIEMEAAAVVPLPLTPFGYRAVTDINKHAKERGITKAKGYIDTLGKLLQHRENVEVLSVACPNLKDAAISLARDHNAQVIYTGCREQSAINRVLLGSFSHSLLHNSKCSVFIAKRQSPSSAS